MSFFQLRSRTPPNPLALTPETGNIQAGVSDAVGTATMTLVGAVIFSAIFTASGTATLTATGASTAASVYSATGTGTCTAVASLPVTEAIFTAAATGTLTATGAALSVQTSVLSASGAGSLAGIGARTHAAAVISTATGTLTGSSAAVASGAWAASSTGALSATGSSTHAGALAASGIATATTVGAKNVAGSLSASATGTLSGTSASTHAGLLSASSVATLTTVGAPRVAASLSATATGTFTAIHTQSNVTGTGALTSAAASLDSTGVLGYNGTASLESAKSSLSATGTTAGGRRKQGGYRAEDLAGYHRFVNQSVAILEELGQAPIEPLPPVEVVHPTRVALRPPDYRESLATALEAIQIQPVAVPTLTVTGKRWLRGSAALSSLQAGLSAQGQQVFRGEASVNAPGQGVQALGIIDNYYSRRQEDDTLIEQFILRELYGDRTV